MRLAKYAKNSDGKIFNDCKVMAVIYDGDAVVYQLITADNDYVFRTTEDKILWNK